MSDIAIRAENLGKWYPIGEPERYTMLRDRVAHSLAVPFRRLLQRRKSRSRGDQQGFADLRTPLTGSYPQQVHALKDVSFEIKCGEIVGIIGQNGAGKSTLLKILSRITEPSEGDAFVYGRIGSLLEVGTGFHPELTGRENVYLNGAIIGMKKAEIDRKFDEIVAFAEIEKFIDTPVKRYSSGMYVRLAFGVAAHLETEVLLVDEVLAVGDAQFQKKCFDKMREIGTQGRTILFVSHNMSAVRSICEQALIIEKGKVMAQGEIDETIDRYLSQISATQDLSEAVETNTFSLRSVEITSTTGPEIKTFDPVQVQERHIP